MTFQNRDIVADKFSKQESSETYRCIVCVLSARHRVIRCKHGLQWILQKRAKKTGPLPWAGRRYCQTKKALIRDSRTLCGEIDPIAMSILEALPDRISQKGQK